MAQMSAGLNGTVLERAADRAQMDQLATTTVIETPAAVDIEGNDRLDDRACDRHRCRWYPHYSDEPPEQEERAHARHVRGDDGCARGRERG